MADIFTKEQDARNHKKLIEKQTGKKFLVYRHAGEWYVEEKKPRPVVDWDKVEKDFNEGWDF